MKDFKFKELDEEGLETLEAIVDASRFNEWMYQTISRNLEGRILEIGSGIGNISAYFLRDQRQLHLSDIRDNYCHYLRREFQDRTTLDGISTLDLVHPHFDREYAEFHGGFDSIFALNVVEHIEDHNQAIANCKKLLKRNGSREYFIS